MDLKSNQDLSWRCYNKMNSENQDINLNSVSQRKLWNGKKKFVFPKTAFQLNVWHNGNHLKNMQSFTTYKTPWRAMPIFAKVLQRTANFELLVVIQTHKWIFTNLYKVCLREYCSVLTKSPVCLVPQINEPTPPLFVISTFSRRCYPSNTSGLI